MRHENQFRNRGRFEVLESRRLLAADAFSTTLAMDVNVDGRISALDALRVINDLSRTQSAHGLQAIEGADLTPSPDGVDHVLRVTDVNRDGVLSARDALKIINELDFNGEIRIGSRLVSNLRQRLDQSRPGILEGVFGGTESADQTLSQLFERINGLRDELGLSSDETGQFLESLAGILEQGTLPSLESITALTEIWSEVWTDQELSDTERQQLRTVLGDVLDSAGISSDRIDNLLNTVEEIYDRVANSLENDTPELQFSEVLEQLQRIFRGLPGFDLPEEWDQTVVRRVADRIDGLLRGEGAAGSVLELIETFRETDVELTIPSLSATLALLNDFRSARSDGVVDESERQMLRVSLDGVLASMGMESGTRDALLNAIGSLSSTRQN